MQRLPGDGDRGASFFAEKGGENRGKTLEHHGQMGGKWMESGWKMGNNDKILIVKGICLKIDQRMYPDNSYYVDVAFYLLGVTPQ